MVGGGGADLEGEGGMSADLQSGHGSTEGRRSDGGMAHGLHGIHGRNGEGKRRGVGEWERSNEN